MNEQLPAGGGIPGARIYERYRRPDPDALPADGEEFCSHCGESHEEGDMYRLGGDGDWMCVPCIVGTDMSTVRWKRSARIIIRTLVALLGLRELTPTCKATIDEANEFLEGM